jgi:hypothetical protein
VRVGLAPAAVANRWPDRREPGQPTTSRDFTSLALAKMGVVRLIDADGQVREAAAPPAVRAA